MDLIPGTPSEKGSIGVHLSGECHSTGTMETTEVSCENKRENYSFFLPNNVLIVVCRISIRQSGMTESNTFTMFKRSQESF